MTDDGYFMEIRTHDLKSLLKSLATSLSSEI
jgi:hypothetical protein